MNFEEREPKKNNCNNLMLTTRIISITALFEYLGILIYATIVIFILGAHDKIQIWNDLELLNERVAKFVKVSATLGILIFLAYIVFIVINHRMFIQKNKKIKNILIMEIFLLVIFMLLPAILSLS